MTYSAIHNQFIINQKDLPLAAMCFKEAIKHARQMAGVPLGKRKREGPLTHLDHLERDIIEGAKFLGINFGVMWGCDLDVSDLE